MKWRWLPAGDSFVDYFLSRDSDSPVLEREFDAINEWIDAKKLVHAMRDHPQHGVPLLGGLWGMSRKFDTQFADRIFKEIVRSDDKSGSTKRLNKKGLDQDFLGAKIWPLVLNTNSYIVHASFFCPDWFSGHTRPFPSKRVGNCFAGTLDMDCHSRETAADMRCSDKCKPENRTDWIYC